MTGTIGKLEIAIGGFEKYNTHVTVKEPDL
jgi:hypothetical protein